MARNRRSGDYTADPTKKSGVFNSADVISTYASDREKEEDVKTMDPERLFQTQVINLNKIDSHEHNTYGLRAIEPLSLSFIKHRMWQVPLVKEAYDTEMQRLTGRYVMIAGHRRLAAYRLILSISDKLLNDESLEDIYSQSSAEMHQVLNKIIAIIKEDPQTFLQTYSAIPVYVLKWNCTKEEEESALNDTNLHNRQTEADEALKQIDYIISDNDIDMKKPVKSIVKEIKIQFELLGYESWSNSKIRMYLLAYQKQNHDLNDAIQNNQLTMRQLEFLVAYPSEEISKQLKAIIEDPDYINKAKAIKIAKNTEKKTKKYRSVSINVDSITKRFDKMQPDLVKAQAAAKVSNKYSDEEKQEKINALKQYKKDISNSINNLIKLLVRED